MIYCYIIIIMLLIVVILLSMALFYFIKKFKYIPPKDREFINFTIDIYSDFGEELGVESKEEHDKLVKILKNIQNKYLK